VVSRFERNTNRSAGRKILGLLVPLLDRDDTIGFVYTEWVLRAGARLYVHGEASDRYGELAFGKPEHGLFLISTRTEAEVKASSVRKQKLLAFGGLGAAVLRIVLLVLATVA
jgi:E3 Ubiquitin ligase